MAFAGGGTGEYPSAVPRWLVVSGPRAFRDGDHLNVEYGWAYEIERDRERRQIAVYVGPGITVDNVPDECIRAIRTDGRSTVEAVLGRDDPPRYIELTANGTREREAA